MLFVLIVIAHTTNNALLNAFWLKADEVEYFSCVLIALGTLWVFKMS